MAKLLVVEDDRNHQLLLQEELTEEGHEVVLAKSGEEALELIETAAPDLVVLDIAMPGMDGVEALGRILSRDNRLPVILHTAYATYKDNFMTWSADAYVVKSSDRSELKIEIERVLARRAQNHES
jgi:CheY-like chemotaxis protein